MAYVSKLFGLCDTEGWPDLYGLSGTNAKQTFCQPAPVVLVQISWICLVDNKVGTMKSYSSTQKSTYNKRRGFLLLFELPR